MVHAVGEQYRVFKVVAWSEDGWPMIYDRHGLASISPERMRTDDAWRYILATRVQLKMRDADVELTLEPKPGQRMPSNNDIEWMHRRYNYDAFLRRQADRVEILEPPDARTQKEIEKREHEEMKLRIRNYWMDE